MRAAMQSSEREMLRDSLRRLVVETDGPKLPAALDDFGWPDLLAEDPAEAIAALFSVQGETVTATPAINVVMAAPLLVVAGLPAGGVGEWTVLLPAPGAAAGSTAVGYAVGAGATIGRCLVVEPQGDGSRLLALDLTAGDARPAEGIDPDLGLLRIDRDVAPAAAVFARGDAATAAWEQAVAAGRVSLACELAGVSRAMLALGVEHAQERRQFGQPIGRFQAVKHRLAEAKVALVAAEAAIDEALMEPGPLAALLAKLWAGRAARMAGKQVQQVLGGMGFTWEHPFHRHLRRILALDGLLGSAAALQHDLGRTLLVTGAAPQLARL